MQTITRQLANKATIFFKEVQLIVSLLVNVQRQGLQRKLADLFWFELRVERKGQTCFVFRRQRLLTDLLQTKQTQNMTSQVNMSSNTTVNVLTEECFQSCHTFFEQRFGDNNDEV